MQCIVHVIKVPEQFVVKSGMFSVVYVLCHFMVAAVDSLIVREGFRYASLTTIRILVSFLLAVVQLLVVRSC